MHTGVAKTFGKGRHHWTAYPVKVVKLPLLSTLTVYQSAS